MSYPKKLLRLRPTKGIASDTPAHEVNLEHYTRGTNVLFRRGFAGRILGSRAVYGTLPVSVLHLLNARSPGGVTESNFWLVFGASAIHAEETSNTSNVTFVGQQTITQPWQWSSCLLNAVPVANNGLDVPLYWAGDVLTPFVALPGWPAGTICKSIAAFRYHLFALDIDGPSGHFESQVLWSNAAEPGAVPDTWAPAANNEAGDTELGDTPGPALTAVPLRGSMLIYKRSSMYAADYVGGEDKFTFRTLFTSSGALTRHAVCDVNGQHFVVTDGDIIMTDGTNRRSVGQARMRNFLFNQLDQTNYENLFVQYHRAKNEVLVCFPEAGNQYCTRALVYDVANDAFGERALANVTCAAVGIVNDTAQSEAWDADAQAWDADSSYWNAANYSFATESLVLGYGTTAEMQDTQDNVAANASVARYDLTFDEPERVKFIKRLHVRAEAGYGTLYVRVGSRMTPTDGITWSAEQTLIEPGQIVNTFAQGRYISLEIRSTGVSVWTITGVDFEFEMRGYH